MNIITLQKHLASLGLYHGQLDGEAGPLTFAGLYELAAQAPAKGMTEQKRKAAHRKSLTLAGMDLGISEIAGRRHNPRVLAMHRAAHLPDEFMTDETAWCGSALCAWVQAGGGKPPLAAYRAKQWLTWGSDVIPTRAIAGDAVVWPSAAGGSGYHVTMLLAVLPAADARNHHLVIIGGNQANKCSIQVRPAVEAASLRTW